MIRRSILFSSLFVVFLAACQPPAEQFTAVAVTQGVVIEPEGFIQRIHDPVMAHDGDTYYVFSTGSFVPFLCSKDKIVWEFCGRVFKSNPTWTRDINPNLVDIWAPDISFFNNQWHLYYAVSTFGSQHSAIGLTTNVTLDPEDPDYEWVDQGEILRSHEGDPWNAIDPNLVLDEHGEPWLAWGSFWDGIWMQKVDRATGKLDPNGSTYHLADRSNEPNGNSAIEAPFLLVRDGMWYLFISFDRCCQGVNSTYNVRVGRSDALTGPYIDRDGVPLTEGGGTLILSAYGQWKGPGHNGILFEDGMHWMVYHAYDARQIGISKLRIESISWDAEGWPSLPSQTQNP